MSIDTYHIRLDIPQAEWEAFLQAQPQASFLQSTYMESMHTALGNKTWRFGVMHNDLLVGVCFATLITARRGWHLYIPYGPVMLPGYANALAMLMEHIVRTAKEARADFIRCSPFLPNTPENVMAFKKLGFHPAPIHVLAEDLWILDITLSPEELLKNMRKTMRNLIKRAEKDGVTITTSQNPKDIEQFITVHQETVTRHGFTPYTNTYFRAQAEAFLPRDLGTLYFAWYEGKVICSAFIMYYGDSGAYHHGASLSEYNKIPASYLLQWQAILEAQRRGMKYYNFWGIVPEDRYYSKILKRPHPFMGLSKFKTGFGGYEYHLMHCQDKSLSSKYQLTKIIETLRRIKRGH